jgi:hypothetical protein
MRHRAAARFNFDANGCADGRIEMPEFPNEAIQSVRQRLLDGMVNFMKAAGNDQDAESGCGYSPGHVDRCAKILDEYLATVAADKKLSEARIREAVKTAVCELNSLNDECDGALIETDQREELCQIILVAATEAGLTTTDDITEEWREW